MKKTPLYEAHIKLGATVGEFGGWEMPLWYKTGQIAEHNATRKNAGLFDICHMGEFVVTGKDSFDYWNKILTNKISRVVDGQAIYNFMLNETAGVIDDCILYRYNAEKWMLVVNAGTQDGDFEWLKQQIFGDVKVKNIGDETGKLDLQGPFAPKIIAEIAGKESIDGMKFFRFIPDFDLGGKKVILSRTGYTGEIGFEIYCDVNDTVDIWNMLLEKGEKYGIKPCGLGARDTLRLEAGLPLHGHEIRPDIPVVGTPWNFAINMDHDFVGKDLLEESEGDYFSYAIITEGKRKSGDHSKVVVNGEEIGILTSEILAVSLEKKPAGYIRTEKELPEGTEIELINAKGRSTKAVTAATPLVKGTSRKKMSIFLG